MLALVCAAGVSIPMWLQYVPFAVSLVVLGLPHGAADHLVPAWLDRRQQSFSSIARVVCIYVVLAGTTLALWAWSPSVASVAFVLLTWFHWGQGDLYVLLAVDNSQYLTTRWLRVLTVVVRGGLPMLVPLLFHSDAFRRVLTDTARLFDASVGAPTLLDGNAIKYVLGGVFVAVIAASALATWQRAGDRASWRRDQMEVVVLFAFFAAVPPILAVGLYFSLWHALRHFVRLDAIAEPPHRKHITYMIRACAPTTALALIFLGLFAFFVPNATDTGGAALAIYLVLISTLTVPHVAVVTYMDYRQRVWIIDPPDILCASTSTYGTNGRSQ